MSSRRNNLASSITGILMYGGGMFMQVLEGPEQDVLRKYVRILDDPRHRDAQILYISPANDRIFEKWSMGSIESDPLQFQYISKLRARRLEVIESNKFTETMREFAKMLRDAK